MPAIAVLPAAIIALAILFAIGAILLILEAPIRRIPVVGPRIVTWMNAFFRSATQGVQIWASNNIGHFTRMIGNIRLGLLNPLNAVLQAAIRINERLINFQVAVGLDETRIYERVNGNWTKMWNHVHSVYESILNDTIHDFWAVGLHSAGHLVSVPTRIEGYLRAAGLFYNGATHNILPIIRSFFVAAGIGTVEHVLNVPDLINSAVDGLRQQVGSDIQQVDNAISSTAADLHNQVEQAISEAENYAGAQVRALGKTIAPTASDVVNGAISALEGDSLGRMAAVWAGIAPLVGVRPATLPLALQGVVSAVSGVAGEIDNCLEPNCAPLNDMGSIWKFIQSLEWWALLLAYLTAAVEDPVGTADFTANDIASPLADVVDATMSLLGLG